jgi:tetratricopeptide (TPR) repeat protein
MEVLERIDLLDDISTKVRKGEYWGKQGAIETALKHADSLGKEHEYEGLSVLSAVFYSAGMHALALWKASPWWLPNFPAYVKYMSCLHEAENYSNDWLQKIGSRSTSPEKLQVRAEILFECKKYKEAKFLIEEALDFKGINPNTKALLLIFRAKILWREEDRRGAGYQYQLARNILAHLNAPVSVRVRMAISEYLLEMGDYEGALRETDIAQEIAYHSGLYDLRLKLQPLLNKVGKRQ